MLLLVNASSQAQGLSAEEILRQAEGDSTRIQELLSLLDNPDPHVRSVALDSMVRKGSDYERHRALQRAFVSGDENLRHAAIKYRLEEVTTLMVDLKVRQEDRDQLSNAALNGFGDDLTFHARVRLDSVDFRTGQFVVQRGTPGVVNGDEVVFDFGAGTFANIIGRCTAELQLTTELSLEGVSRCSRLGFPIPTSVQLM